MFLWPPKYLFSVERVETVLEKCNKRITDEEIDQKDIKTKSKNLRYNLNKIAKYKSIELRLKRK